MGMWHSSKHTRKATHSTSVDPISNSPEHGSPSQVADAIVRGPVYSHPKSVHDVSQFASSPCAKLTPSHVPTSVSSAPVGAPHSATAHWLHFSCAMIMASVTVRVAMPASVANASESQASVRSCHAAGQITVPSARHSPPLNEPSGAQPCVPVLK